jgi:hypothetical protein
MILKAFTGSTSETAVLVAARAAGTFTGDQSIGGHSLTDFKNGGSATDVLLDSNSPISVATWEALAKYHVTFGCRLRVWTDSTSGTIDCAIDVRIVVDGSGDATLTLQTVPAPDNSRLPSGFTPALTLGVASNVLTIYATRPASVACLAYASYWFQSIDHLDEVPS